MAISEAYANTASITTTENSCVNNSSTIATETTDGVYQLFLDVSDMIAGDELQIRLYEKCRSGDTQRLVEQWSLTGAQGRPIWATPAMVLLHGWDFSLKTIAGTSITVNWSIRKVA